MSSLREKLSGQFSWQQLSIDLGLLVGFLVVRFLFGLIFPQGLVPRPVLFILLTCLSLTLMGGFAGSLLQDYLDGLDLEKKSGRILSYLFMAVFALYGIAIIVVHPVLLFSPIAQSLGGFISDKGEISFFTIFSMAAPFGFVGLGFALKNGLNIPSVKPFIRLVRFIAGLLYVATLPLWMNSLRQIARGPYQIQIFMAILIAGALIVVGILPMLLKRLILFYKNKPEFRARLQTQKWLPFVLITLVSFVLYLWNDSMMHTVIRNILADRQVLNFSDFILLLLIGPIPLRLLVALQPSRKILGKLLSLVILILLIWQMYHQFLSLVP